MQLHRLGVWGGLVFWVAFNRALGMTQDALEPRFTGEPMSLNFASIEVRSALQVVADFTGMNIVTSDSVTGSLSLRLKNVPWDQVLNIIAQAKGLVVRQQGNVIWIAPRAEVAASDKLEYESRLAIQNLEQLQTRAFALNYAKAHDVVLQVLGAPVASNPVPNLAGLAAVNSPSNSVSARVLSVRGSVMAEPRTNQLFVTDIASRIDQVAQMIERIDVPLRQVMIEARIVQASDTFGRVLGARLSGVLGGEGRLAVGSVSAAGVTSGASNAATSGQASGVINNALNGASVASTSGALSTSAQFVNLPAGGINGFASASFPVSIFNATKNQFLNLELSALESDGKGRVISNPRVVTADQAKAIIEQGTELPYQTAAASGATSIAFRKANLKLEVTPQITPEGGIMLDLDISKDSVGQITPAGFAIDTKHVNTQVLVDNGGTVMIGGIYETTEQEDEYKVPLLGDIPLLGVFFKNHRRSSSRQELLVFVTPKMLDHRVSTR